MNLDDPDELKRYVLYGLRIYADKALATIAERGLLWPLRVQVAHGEIKLVFRARAPVSKHHMQLHLETYGFHYPVPNELDIVVYDVIGYSYENLFEYGLQQGPARLGASAHCYTGRPFSKRFEAHHHGLWLVGFAEQSDNAVGREQRNSRAEESTWFLKNSKTARRPRSPCCGC